MSLATVEARPRAVPAVRRARIVAVANQKGGVGKTTTAINLGTALAAIGEEVLIVDLDPQGNASTGLGIDRKSRRRSTYDVLTREIPVREAIQETAVPRLHIVPSTMDLSGFELEIVGLADIIVYVASDERYNDEVPTGFLRLILQTGKPVIVCLVKMPEADQAAIIEHFRQEVLNRMPGGVVRSRARCLMVWSAWM